MRMAVGARRRDLLRALPLLGTGVALPGCIGGSPPPPRLFYLNPLAEPPGGVSPVDWSLVVELPQTTPALNTTRIVQVVGANQFNYYDDGEWGDQASVMVQAVVIRSFERSGAIPVVVNELQFVRPDFRLASSLAPFFARGAVGSAPVAAVGLQVELVQSRGRQVVASRSFEASAQAASAELDAIVAAFDEATHQVLRELIPWTLDAGAAAWSPNRS